MRAGYNLVEVLVTLTIASIITITLVNFVNDVDMRHKVAIARADVNRISQAAHLAEAELSRITTLPPGSSNPVLNLTSGSKLAWALQTKLLDVPSEDPWGNKFFRVDPVAGAVRYERATQPIELTTASPYIVDEGLGRVISAGPDGIVDTHVGQDPSDSEADIVIEYRHKPWLFYCAGNKMYVNSADGGANPTSTAGIFMGAGTNATVSPDGLRFAAVADSRLIIGTLAWALETEGASPVPRTDEVIVAGQGRDRLMTFSQNRWATESAQLPVDEKTFPVWLPDSSGIVFQSGGHIYRYDGARGPRDGPARGEVLRLTSQSLISASGSSTGKRTLFTTRKYGAYIDQSLDLCLTVSGDGKVAFRDTAHGVSLVLGDGTARRTVKKGGGTIDLWPLAWIDNNNILYWDKGAKRLSRIAQDATIDIPLHQPNAPSVDTVLNPVMSPDGRFMAFHDGNRGFIVKTDGTGFLAQENVATTINFSGSGMKETPRLLWRLSADCALYRTLYVPTSDSSKPVATQRVTPSDKLYFNLSSVTDPEDCSTIEGVAVQSRQSSLLEGLSSLYFDLSRDQKLLAVISEKDPNQRLFRGTGGVFIVPLVGNSRAITRLDVPGVSGDGYSYVSWLLN